MKTKISVILIFALLGFNLVHAQVGVFNSAEETARRLDSLEGKSTPERRQNAENNINRNNGNPESNSQNPNNNRRPGNNDPLQRRWDEMLGENLSIFKEGMDKFDTQETRCIFIMVVYLSTYWDLVQTTYDANDCRTKHDGYAMQSIAIAAGASFMYCPESLSKLTEEEKNRIWVEDFMPIMENEDNNQMIIEWKTKYRSLGGRGEEGVDPRPDRNLINDLVSFFHPNNIIAKLLNIQQNMEELNCPD